MQVEPAARETQSWSGPSGPSPSPVPEQPLPSPARAYTQGLAASAASMLMRFMHKPSRAHEELKKASDTTRKNSLLNANLSKTDSGPNSGTASPQPRAALLSDVSSPSSSPRAPPPRLLRKKSGEIVKPLLKESSSYTQLAKAKSLPSTPTYKSVHFGGDADVRYFKEKDKPAAISALNSPTGFEDDDDDDDDVIPAMNIDQGPIFDLKKTLYFDYYDDELNSHPDAYRPPTHAKWLLRLLNFSQNSIHDAASAEKAIFLENLFLLADHKYILGQIAVMNMAFEKHVNVRYSLDGWHTIVEILAFYVPQTPLALKAKNYDRFMFKILLDLFFSGIQDPLCESRIPELCIKYNTPGTELWDNNNGLNYLFDLRRTSDISSKPTSPAEQVPSSARTKQQAHTQRPKYSSSYLKRMDLDPGMSTSFKAKDTKRPEMPARQNYNDFESNDFYLSSPLLRDLRTKPTDEDLLKQALDVASPAISGRTTVSSDEELAESMQSPPREHVGRRFLLDSWDAPRSTKKLHESMSYKELLDSYCFFHSNSHDNNSKTTIVLGDEPGVICDERSLTGESNNPMDPIYTVSSFLK